MATNRTLHTDGLPVKSAPVVICGKGPVMPASPRFKVPASIIGDKEEKLRVMDYYNSIQSDYYSLPSERLDQVFGMLELSPGNYRLRQNITSNKGEYRLINDSSLPWIEGQPCHYTTARQKNGTVLLYCASLQSPDRCPRNYRVQLSENLTIDRRYLIDAFRFHDLPFCWHSMSKLSAGLDSPHGVVGKYAKLPLELKYCIVDQLNLPEADLVIRNSMPELTEWWTKAELPRKFSHWFNALCSRDNLKYAGYHNGAEVYRFKSVDLHPTFEIVDKRSASEMRRARHADAVQSCPGFLTVKSKLMAEFQQLFFGFRHFGIKAQGTPINVVNGGAEHWVRAVNGMLLSSLLSELLQNVPDELADPYVTEYVEGTSHDCGLENLKTILPRKGKRKLVERVRQTKYAKPKCEACYEQSLHIMIDLASGKYYDPVAEGRLPNAQLLLVYLDELREIFKSLHLVYRNGLASGRYAQDYCGEATHHSDDECYEECAERFWDSLEGHVFDTDRWSLFLREDGKVKNWLCRECNSRVPEKEKVKKPWREVAS